MSSDGIVSITSNQNDQIYWLYAASNIPRDPQATLTSGWVAIFDLVIIFPWLLSTAHQDRSWIEEYEFEGNVSLHYETTRGANSRKNKPRLYTPKKNLKKNCSSYNHTCWDI